MFPPRPPCGAPKTGPRRTTGAANWSSSDRLRSALPHFGTAVEPLRGEEESVNHEPKSVTDVLNQKCYLCIDCASPNQPSAINHQPL
jgi:hypothetical protein